MLLLNHIVIKATSLILGGRSQNFKKARACLDVKFWKTAELILKQLH